MFRIYSVVGYVLKCLFVCGGMVLVRLVVGIYREKRLTEPEVGHFRAQGVPMKIFW